MAIYLFSIISQKLWPFCHRIMQLIMLICFFFLKKISELGHELTGSWIDPAVQGIQNSHSHWHLSPSMHPTVQIVSWEIPKLLCVQYDLALVKWRKQKSAVNSSALRSAEEEEGSEQPDTGTKIHLSEAEKRGRARGSYLGWLIWVDKLVYNKWNPLVN